MKRSIWWIRRDMRLTDNSALHAALAAGGQVIPVFVLDDKLLASARLRGPRIAWMLDGLRVLDATLRQHGGRLIIRRGDPSSALPALCSETGADVVYFNRDYSPYATRRDLRVSRALRGAGYRVETFKDLVIHEADEIASQSGRPYGVYSPFRRAWEKLPKPVPLTYSIHSSCLVPPADMPSLPIPQASELGARAVSQPIVPPGEDEARRYLEAFVSGPIRDYHAQRNMLAADGTSILSPYLRWGMLSPRACYRAAQEALDTVSDQTVRASVQSWIGELVWREFNYYVLATHPHIVRCSFRPAFDTLPWENNTVWLDAWAAGQTGFPIIDAAMRQLETVGWMHNRARMIVASFLCKDLLVDWRYGEAIFMQRLLDGDVANNVGGWQWTAGTGTDAAPYFRIFNPTIQSETYDPEGAYIRQWLPELARVPRQFVHMPAKMTPEQQVQYHCAIGQDYPAPLVDHGVQRERALAFYGAMRRPERR